jgi:hypothetical protein
LNWQYEILEVSWLQEVVDVLNFLKKASPLPSRSVEVGWIIDADKAGFVWSAPQKVAREGARVRHAKSVNVCPAVLDHEARFFEVTCPIDLHLRFQVDEKTRQPRLVNVAGDQSTARPKTLAHLVHLVAPKEWRDPNRPILQLLTPYLFLADEPVYMTQMPPICHYRNPPWPGVLIGGRLPIHIWPRPMMWAFEWYDPKQELILRRGEPWFYVRFETEDPSRPVRLLEAEMTPQLKEYVGGLNAVTNYVNRTFSLFSTARERRPKRLLVAKQR